MAYEQNRARNVYNLAFKDWWELAGESWESRHLFATSKLTIDEVTTYLDRIGVTYDDCSRTCDLAFLTDIVRGTLASIPFQNFTMLREVPRTRPTKAQIVDAMLTGVGGLCSVRNTFLYLLLRTLGYAVQFLSCTIHLQTDASLLENAHMALLVTIGTDSYWLDIGNGFPYKTPLSLSAAGGTDDQKAPVIDHSYISVRLVRRSQKFHIEHRLAGSCEWKTNNTFDAPQDSPTPFVHFDDLHFNHYNPSKRFLGPFLNSLRFNVWARDDSFLVIRFDACEGTPPSSFTIIEKSKQGGSIEKLFDQSKECARSRIFISVATRDWRESLQREGLRSTWKFAILMQDAWNTLCCK